jgi:hypothetical protein
MDRVNRSNCILEPELLMGARHRHRKLRLRQCRDRRRHSTKVITAAKTASEIMKLRMVVSPLAE